MTPETMVEDITGLLEVWVAGWAGCRGYTTSTEGRFPAVLRNDASGDWEYFASEPTDDEFAALAAKTAEVPARVLTILTNDVARYSSLAARQGLNVTSDSQTMMIVDMETQDAEDPWLSDDDLALQTASTMQRSGRERPGPPADGSLWWARRQCSTKSSRSRLSSAAAWAASSCGPWQPKPSGMTYRRASSWLPWTARNCTRTWAGPPFPKS